MEAENTCETTVHLYQDSNVLIAPNVYVAGLADIAHEAMLFRTLQ
jgi:hypothetical protein